jgi:hypothetical protein
MGEAALGVMRLSKVMANAFEGGSTAWTIVPGPSRWV